MQTIDANLVLDRQQLRDITLDEKEIMREILKALVEDTSGQIGLIETAIRERDQDRCKRLAHYCKGACANVGANSAAAVLRRMEWEALARDFDGCARSLAALGGELEKLKVEMTHL